MVCLPFKAVLPSIEGVVQILQPIIYCIGGQLFASVVFAVATLRVHTCVRR